MASKNDIKRSPIDFIYYFANDQYIAIVAANISAKAAETIRSKRENQKKVLANLYGSVKKRDEQAASELTAYIQDIYGKTPQDILVALLNGDTVAGKNYGKGVYGVGSTEPLNTFGDDSSELYVDSDNGQIFQDGKYLTGGTPIYAKKNGKTYVSGYAYQYEGKSYTTSMDKNTGKFYANTYGTSDNMYNADGTVYDPSYGTFWDAMETAQPFIVKLIEWIKSVLSAVFNINFVDGRNTLPAQSEYVADEPGTNTASLGIIGALLVGGALLMNEPKKGGKKK